MVVTVVVPFIHVPTVTRTDVITGWGRHDGDGDHVYTRAYVRRENVETTVHP